MIYVIETIELECGIEINFQDCSLNAEVINRLANALGKSTTIKVKGLNLSGNRLDNSLLVDFFIVAAFALHSL